MGGIYFFISRFLYELLVIVGAGSRPSYAISIAKAFLVSGNNKRKCGSIGTVLLDILGVSNQISLT